MAGFFGLPADIIRLIYEFDPTYRLVWSEVVHPKPHPDKCVHGHPIFHYDPHEAGLAVCPGPSCQRKVQREHDFWERIQEEEEIWEEEQRAWERRWEGS